MAINPANNFLVPQSGKTSVYTVRENFQGASIPYPVNFRDFILDGQPFRPYGLILDNTKGTDTLTVLINEIGFHVSAPPGSTTQMPYPAPRDHTATIFGEGEGVVVFVNYPVTPFVGIVQTEGGGTVPQPLQVTGMVEIDDSTPINVATHQTVEHFEAKLITATGDGMIVNAIEASFFNSGSANADVADGELPPNTSVTFRAPNGGNFPFIHYDATGTTLLISYFFREP